MKPKKLTGHQPERMSVAERVELGKVVRLNAKIAKNDVMASIAVQLANVEQQLAAEYSKLDAHWAELTKEADEKVSKVDAELARRCRELGVPETFRPELRLSWYRRGDNASKERRAELRRVAESTLEARAQQAKVVIERREAQILTQLTSEGLTTEGARAFLQGMPSIDELMPKLQLTDLEEKRPLLGKGRDDVD
jgi:hypothetical protein